MDSYQNLTFRLAISPDQFLNYYRGHSQSVLALTQGGKRIQFPANALRPYLEQEGIHGSFKIQFDKNNKLVNLQKLSR